MRIVSLLVLILGGCATSPSVNYATPFCEQLSVFADSVPAGESRTVKLARGGRWLVDHYKTCARHDEETSADFCDWLMEHTSTEFMEANINVALSCLQGQKIVGYIGNTGIEKWLGSATFFAPQIESKNVEITIDYHVDYSREIADDYLQITVEAE